MWNSSNVSDNWWERSPNGSNTTNFCNVNNNGNANNNSASNSNGVRPDFGDTENKTSKIGEVHSRKERPSLPDRLNDSVATRNRPVPICPMGADKSVALSGA